jgi:hypothetical protein
MPVITRSASSTLWPVGQSVVAPLVGCLPGLASRGWDFGREHSSCAGGSSRAHPSTRSPSRRQVRARGDARPPKSPFRGKPSGGCSGHPPLRRWQRREEVRRAAGRFARLDPDPAAHQRLGRGFQGHQRGRSAGLGCRRPDRGAGETPGWPRSNTRVIRAFQASSKLPPSFSRPIPGPGTGGVQPPSGVASRSARV